MAIYAIDFDNTLAITRFPEIIAPNKKMVAFAKAVKAQGHQIILWTSRAGADLENAVEWCRLQGLVFDAVNEPLPEQIKELMEAETWLSGEEAAKYFNVSVGEENTAVAAVQDYTKLYCKNTPEALAGGNPPDDTKDQAAAKEKEIRSKIAALTIKHME